MTSNDGNDYTLPQVFQDGYPSNNIAYPDNQDGYPMEQEDYPNNRIFTIVQDNYPDNDNDYSPDLPEMNDIDNEKLEALADELIQIRSHGDEDWDYYQPSNLYQNDIKTIAKRYKSFSELYAAMMKYK